MPTKELFPRQILSPVVNMKTNEISPFASGDQRETCTEAEKKGEENRDEETRRHAGMKTE